MTSEEIGKQLTILIRKMNSIEFQLNQMQEQYGHISAEIQRLRQIINKGVKS